MLQSFDGDSGLAPLNLEPKTWLCLPSLLPPLRNEALRPCRQALQLVVQAASFLFWGPGRRDGHLDLRVTSRERGHSASILRNQEGSSATGPQTTLLPRSHRLHLPKLSTAQALSSETCVSNCHIQLLRPSAPSMNHGALVPRGQQRATHWVAETAVVTQF